MNTTNINEVDDYVAYRYISSLEACWRIFKFSIHHHKPIFTKFLFHLENEQQVYFRDEEPFPIVMDGIDPNATMFVRWFQINKEDSTTRNLTFVEFPEKFLWDETQKIWKRQNNKIYVIGRIIYVRPTAGNFLQLRLYY